MQRRGIELVADVRSSPYCRYATQFNREPLHAALRNCSIGYRYYGDRLGGRVDDPSCYDEDGRVLYGRVAESPNFRAALDELLGEAAAVRTTILCGEENPADCHRRLLIGRVARQQGVCLMHLRGDGREQAEEQLEAEERYRKTRGQLNLFETEEAGEWKSTQSVSPKKTPPSSSTPCERLAYED